MSYNAKILNIMIASPNDVKIEKNIIRDSIYQWNYINSYSYKIVLMLIEWETCSSPLMGDRPQEIINNQLLKNCDILIGTFWTRIGSPTGKAESGTVEEIEEHLKNNKPAMLYFSTIPVVYESVDEEQFKKLKKFKTDCKTKGLIEEYSSIEEFQKKFFNQLSLLINNKFSPQNYIENNLIEKTTIQINLSDEAAELLTEAVKDGSVNIIKSQFMGGFNLQTNNKEFIIDNDPRTKAKWESAISELENYELIKDVNYNGFIYNVTQLGYQVSDKLKKNGNGT